ncbi:MAG: hypothetical protein D4R45_04525 [Planctomycetaceae bacterium]|nr:MAG: hypothetical protein D4R45_04525 [Planctomycetaceae bacterium]
MAFAELGLTEKEFFSLPPFRTYLMQMQYNREIERKWEQTRMLASMIHNSAQGKKRMLTPRQIIHLSFDDNTEYSQWTQEEAEELIRKWGGKPN